MPSIKRYACFCRSSRCLGACLPPPHTRTRPVYEVRVGASAPIIVIILHATARFCTVAPAACAHCRSSGAALEAAASRSLGGVAGSSAETPAAAGAARLALLYTLTQSASQATSGHACRMHKAPSVGSHALMLRNMRHMSRGRMAA
jgi:hypothetical protein